MPAASRPSKSRRPSGMRPGHVSIDGLGRGFTVNQSIHSLRKRGRRVQVELTSQEERCQVAIPIDNLVTGEWEVVGSKGNPHPNYDELLPLVARGKLNPGAAHQPLGKNLHRALHTYPCGRRKSPEIQDVTISCEA